MQRLPSLLRAYGRLRISASSSTRPHLEPGPPQPGFAVSIGRSRPYPRAVWCTVQSQLLMSSSFSHRLGAVLVLAGAAACGDVPLPTAPLAPTAAADARAATSTTDENVTYSPLLAQIDARLAASGAAYRVAKAELRIAAAGWNGATSTVIFANDRTRGIGAEWVKGDPRRGGNPGVTYTFGSNTSIAPTTRDPDGSNVRLVSAADQEAYVDEAMSAWRSLTCSSKPITKVPVPAGTDPDVVDELVLGQPPSANYAQPADIVESGWQPVSWFETLAGPDGNFIIGITFSFIFTDNGGNPTDIDHNGKADLALAEIYFNAGFYWGNVPPNVIDFYSSITHESGHCP